MYVIAIIVGSVLLKKEIHRKEIALTDDSTVNWLIWTVIGGVVGARLYYVAFNFSYYLSDPMEIPAIWHGGLAIHGGIIGGVVASILFCRRHSLKFWHMSDVAAPVLILGQTFGRFGNFMNGDAHGSPTDMPWGVVFPAGSIAGTEFPDMATHPTMLYEMAINFGIFALLWFWLRGRKHKDGFGFALYLVLYSTGRFFVEIFRADSLMFGPLKAAQLVSIALVAIALIVIFKKKLWSAEEGI